jgi:cytochrome c biogenesis factor
LIPPCARFGPFTSQGSLYTIVRELRLAYTAAVVAALPFAILETGTFSPLTQGSPGTDIVLIVILVRAIRTLAVPRPKVSAGRCSKETSYVLGHILVHAVVNMDFVGIVRTTAKEQIAILGLVSNELAAGDKVSL